MNGRALVFAPADDGMPWRWCVPDSTGRVTAGAGLDALAAELGSQGPLEGPAATDAVAATPVLLVLPAEDVLATRVQVPTRSRRQLEAALPFVVEEFLAEDVEGLHIVVADRDAEQGVGVRVLAPARLEAAIDALVDSGLQAVAARVDADAIDTDARTAQLWIGADRALLATPTLRTACEPQQLTAFLADLPSTGVSSVVVRLSEDADAALALGELEAWLASEGLACERRDGPLADTLDAALVPALLRDGRGPELLTGPFRPSLAPTTRAPRWGLAAAALIAWLAISTVLDVARTGWLEGRTAQLREDNLAHFREIVPGRTRSPDPRRELEALGGAGGAEGAAFEELLGVIGAALADAGRSELRSLNFNRRRGDLSLDIAVGGIATVDALKARLEAVGYGVSIDSAVQEQQGVRARVRIRTAGAGS